MAKVEQRDGCWRWTGSVDANGYGQFYVGHLRRPVKAHRVAFRLLSKDPGRMHVLHRCDNPPCVNPAHLFLGTQRDNMADMNAKGRGSAARGEQQPRSKITADQVRTIRIERANGVMAKDLGARFGIAPNTVAGIVNGKRWRHIQ